MQVTLTIYSSRDTKQVPMTAERFTIGLDGANNLALRDEGVSSFHATIHRDGDRVWILDENSANGTYVNGIIVPPVGLALKDGAEISLGHDTTIVVSLQNDIVADAGYQSSSDQFTEPSAGIAPVTLTAHTSFPIALVAGLSAALVGLVAVVAIVSYAVNGSSGKQEGIKGPPPVISPTQAVDTPSPAQTPLASPTPPRQDDQQPAASRKLYLQMNQVEQMDFIEQQARHVSLMMGNRPYAFNDDVLRYIKQDVDGYAKRVGNNSTRLWAEDMRFMFARAREQYAPYIISSFNRRGVPPVVGIYLVVIETEYHNIQSENAAGAAGLFQFIGPTARGYGVDPSERTNVAKMAPAAAAYMAERIAEFGTDSMSVALAIAGYNRSADSVRRDLHDVLNSENKERSFWTLVANSNKLDHWFQGENIKYVPKFFAAAIVGENPWAFGIQMEPLSTYTEVKTQPSAGAVE